MATLIIYKYIVTFNNNVIASCSKQYRSTNIRYIANMGSESWRDALFHQYICVWYAFMIWINVYLSISHLYHSWSRLVPNSLLDSSQFHKTEDMMIRTMGLFQFQTLFQGSGFARISEIFTQTSKSDLQGINTICFAFMALFAVAYIYRC